MPWILWGCGGGVAGGLLEVGELAAAARPVAAVDALAVTAIAATFGALAALALAPAAVWALRRRPALAESGAAERWSVAVACFVSAALLGAGIVWTGGAAGVRGGLRTVLLAYAGWCALAAMSAPWIAGRLKGSWGAPRERARRSARTAAALLATLLVAAAIGFTRGGSPAVAALLVATALGGFLLAARAPAGALAAAAVGLAAAALGWRALGGPEPPASPHRPPPGSVVMIVLDTTRADVFGAYGASGGETPAFDRLAAEGAVWEELISTSPWTVPSHATFFTGLPPRVHDCWFGGRRWLVEELETVAERFAASGYETVALFANDYLRASNLLQGFDTALFLESPVADLAIGRLMRELGIGFAAWYDRGGARAVDALDAWLATRERRRPFFLFVNLLEAHDPYVSPWSDLSSPPEVGRLEARIVRHRFDPDAWHALGRRDGRAESIVRASYRASVRYQDRILGRLVETLERHGALESVPVVLTSDHGENLGEGGRWGHQFALNDALLQVPFVVRAPGRVPSGTRIAGSHSTVDTPATLLDLAGLGDRFGDGRSLLAGRPAESATFAEVHPFYVKLDAFEIDFESGLGDVRWPLSAVRSEGHKLVIWHGGPTRLYALADDPGEEVDRLAAEPELAARLFERYASWATSVPRVHRGGASGVRRPLDPELAARLRALGYL